MRLLTRSTPLRSLAAADKSPENKSRILPRLFVRLFFGGWGLCEVHTDETLRITYGGRDLEDWADDFIYIMRRGGP